MGGILPIGLIFFAQVPFEAAVRDFILVFVSIFWEAFPFIVLGAVIAGVVEEMIPQQLLARFIPRNRPLAIGLGAFLGLIFPMCECGIIVVMRRLLRKGLPLSCCVSYILAGPIINPVVLMSTFVAFRGMENATDTSGHLLHQMGSWWMVSLRAGLGWLVAVGTSLIVEWQWRHYGTELLVPLGAASKDDDAVTSGPRGSIFKRLANISATALHDFIDISVFLTLGALIAAAVRFGLTRDDIVNLSQNYPFLSIVLMMGLAVALCLCSEADAFVAASFIYLRPASKVAFLVLGPMFDFKLLLMYTRVFRYRLIVTIFTAVVIQVFLYSLLTHVAWEQGWLDAVGGAIQQVVPFAHFSGSSS